MDKGLAIPGGQSSADVSQLKASLPVDQAPPTVKSSVSVTAAKLTNTPQAITQPPTTREGKIHSPRIILNRLSRD